MLNLKSSVLILVFLLFFLPYGFMPLTSSQQNSYKEISFQPNNMPLVNVYYEDYTFVFSYKQFFIRLAPFVIYNNNYYSLKQIVQFLRNNYPNINYTWLVDKAEHAVHYGFNLTRLPQTIADRIDYLGFRLVDLNFPLSWFKLEEHLIPIDWKTQYNITLIKIPRANLVFSFQDLYPYGYEVIHVNSTYILLGNVKGRTDLIVDPITYSSPTMTVIGGTEGTPLTFWDLWNASNVNGWNVIQNNNGTGLQYEINCQLDFGNGTVAGATWFQDTKKEIVIDADKAGITGIGQTLIYVYAYASFILGELDDATNRIGKNGCVIYFEYNSGRNMYGIITQNWRAVIRLYGCSFINNGTYYFYGWIEPTNYFRLTGTTVNYIAHVYSCKFTGAFSLGWCTSDMPVYWCTFYGGSYVFYQTDADARNIWGFDCYAVGSPYTTKEFGVTDAYFRGITYLAAAANIPGSYISNLTDVDSDNWNMSWWLCSEAARIQRQWTFDLKVVFPNNTAVENANVTISNINGVVDSSLTDINGTIETQILTEGYWHQTVNSSEYTSEDNITSYNPYNLTITSGDLSYSTNFTLSEKTDWIIALTSGDSGIITPLSVGLIIIGCIIVFCVAVAIYSKRH